MSALSKLLVLFALALSVSSLTTPHVGRSLHNHHALAARKAAPEPAPVAAPVEAQVVSPKKLRRRSDGSRCRVKTSSAAASSTPAAASSSSSVSVAPTTTAVPAAVEAAPTTSSEVQTTEAKTTTEAAKETPTSSKVTSSKETPTPEPTSSKVTTSKAPSTTSSASSSSGSLPSFLVGTQTGQGTFYAIGLGACGITNSGNDKIAAVSHLLFDVFPGYNGVNPNSNPICGKSVTATYQGKSVTVQITDRCTGCALTDLDFSPAAFDELADESIGRLSGVTWVWDN